MNQDVVSHNESGQLIGLMLTGLPRHRRALQTGEVTGDAGRAGFKTL
jgi:hypothetical protein